VLELGDTWSARPVFTMRVLDRKVSRGQVFVTDGGMHHHLAASGNFGQVIRRNYPVAIGNRLQSAERESASGRAAVPPLDLLADKLELAVAQPGDLVVVFQSGAYGATASPQTFWGTRFLKCW
jgi:diaminopimelate decarboxylase